MSSPLSLSLLAAAIVCAIGGNAVAQRATPLDSSLWRPQCIPLLVQQYQACYGPGWNKGSVRDRTRFDFYQVSVEKIESPKSSRVLFDRRMFPNEVHSELLTDKPKEVVRFDSATREVVFHVSKQPIVYRLHE
jgi:hypothetical protein